MRMLIAALLLTTCAAAQDKLSVDFRYAPPQWQTAICLPDDAEKTLVDHTGRLLHDFRSGARFNLTIGVTIPNAKLIEQRLIGPRTPIVCTTWATRDLKIVQYAFAVTGKLPSSKRGRFIRQDNGKVLRGWAHPPAYVNPLLGNAAINETGSLRYQLPVKVGFKKRIALAVSEGFWATQGMRVQTIAAEGAPQLVIDTVKDIGKHKTKAFWFDASDANRDGRITIVIKGKRGAIVSGLWAFAPGAEGNSKALVAGELDSKADAVTYASDRTVPVPRCDAILVRVTNTSQAPVGVSPLVVLNSLYPLQYDRANECLRTGSHEKIRLSIPVASVAHHKPSHTVSLEGFELWPGKSRQFHVTRIVGSDAKPDVSLVEATKFWQTTALPYGRITVPDEQLQALVDSSIRNIWQSREMKNGRPAFLAGPTCYRNLWIIDAAFILETAAMLGKWEEARNGIAHVLTHQEKDGRFELIECGHKENGIVLWTCVRHAQLTRDKRWLRAVWPQLERTIGYIKQLRKQALTNETPLDDGLIPAGFVDGGLPYRDRPDLSNSYWCLIGLKAAIAAARWIGKDTTDLQREFDSYLAAFQKVSKREMRADKHGHRYLPILIGDKTAAPEKAQWTFLHAVHPGELFNRNDPIVVGNMAMLKATEKQGMVVNTGWLDDGVWTYFASFYGHTWLWLGYRRKAAKCLYAMADHASPTLVWQEEQPLKWQKYKRIGDMPHNWASAEFIRFTVHLLAFERGDELHLLEGLPREWLKPGMITKLDGILTKFGPLTMSLVISEDGKTARLQVKKLGASCKAVVVHSPVGKKKRLTADSDHDLTIITSRAPD